ncbi:MAG: hypothetical protein VW771_03970, partial [Gammaproteobacteria bacterium]
DIFTFCWRIFLFLFLCAVQLAGKKATLADLTGHKKFPRDSVQGSALPMSCSDGFLAWISDVWRLQQAACVGGCALSFASAHPGISVVLGY